MDQKNLCHRRLLKPLASDRKLTIVEQLLVTLSLLIVQKSRRWRRRLLVSRQDPLLWVGDVCERQRALLRHFQRQLSVHLQETSRDDAKRSCKESSARSSKTSREIVNSWHLPTPCRHQSAVRMKTWYEQWEQQTENSAHIFEECFRWKDYEWYHQFLSLSRRRMLRSRAPRQRWVRLKSHRGTWARYRYRDHPQCRRPCDCCGHSSSNNNNNNFNFV